MSVEDSDKKTAEDWSAVCTVADDWEASEGSDCGESGWGDATDSFAIDWGEDTGDNPMPPADDWNGSDEVQGNPLLPQGRSILDTGLWHCQGELAQLSARNLVLFAARVFAHGKFSATQQDLTMGLLNALVDGCCVSPPGQGGFSALLRRTLGSPAMQTQLFCAACQDLVDRIEVRRVCRGGCHPVPICKQCGEPLRLFHGLDPCAAIESYLEVYKEHVVQQNDLQHFCVRHNGKTYVFDWLGGSIAQRMDLDTQVPVLGNCDGVAVVKVWKASHYFFFLEVACVPRWIRTLRESLMLVGVWDQRDEAAGPFKPRVLVKWLARCLKNGVMHCGELYCRQECPWINWTVRGLPPCLSRPITTISSRERHH